jgi:hypothetical protein
LGFSLLFPAKQGDMNETENHKVPGKGIGNARHTAEYFNLILELKLNDHEKKILWSL